MKPVETLSKENQSTGRFATPEEAARAKNADLEKTLKKLNLQVVNYSVASQKTK